MILITGATGRIGRRVVERLVDAGQHVRVLVRSLDKAERLLPISGEAGPRIEVVVADLANLEIIQSAVQGIDAILLVSPVSPDQVLLQGNIVAASAQADNAAKSSTRRPYIVKISGLGTSKDSYIDSGRWHAETEQQIIDAGLSYTFLRPLFFMQNLQFLLDNARQEGVIRAGVGGAKIAMIDAEDIAEVVAILLKDRLRLVNKAVNLTSLDTVTYQEVARILTELLGREVQYQQQSLEQIRQTLVTAKMPEWHINILMQFNRAFHEGQGDAANTVVSEILGKPPTTLRQYLERELRETSSDESNNPFPS
jgi:uncharacterized protein YbjT (DUF2867 family)